MKIFLVGLPGSGKSFIGKQLAESIQLPFIDLDEAIMVQEGISVSEIFATKGEGYFRQVEATVLRNQISVDDFVMATGGGTPCFFDNMDLMNDNGVSIFLNTPTSVIAERLISEQKNSRPLLANESNIELALEHLLNARFPFYSQATITMQGEFTLTEIIQSINDFSQHG